MRSLRSCFPSLSEQAWSPQVLGSALMGMMAWQNRQCWCGGTLLTCLRPPLDFFEAFSLTLAASTMLISRMIVPSNGCPSIAASIRSKSRPSSTAISRFEAAAHVTAIGSTTVLAPGVRSSPMISLNA